MKVILKFNLSRDNSVGRLVSPCVRPSETLSQKSGMRQNETSLFLTIYRKKFLFLKKLKFKL